MGFFDSFIGHDSGYSAERNCTFVGKGALTMLACFCYEMIQVRLSRCEALSQHVAVEYPGMKPLTKYSLT